MAPPNPIIPEMTPIIAPIARGISKFMGVSTFFLTQSANEHIRRIA
jgi:hypothetical protein